MAWVKLDDNFADHPKVVGLSSEAFRAHVTGLCYAARHLTDGFIPMNAAKTIAKPRARRELAAELWLEIDGGYLINDYLDFNPSRAKVHEDRAKTAHRVAAWRGRNGVINAVEASLRNAVTNGAPVPDPYPYPKEQEHEARAVNASGLGGS